MQENGMTGTTLRLQDCGYSSAPGTRLDCGDSEINQSAHVHKACGLLQKKHGRGLLQKGVRAGTRNRLLSLYGLMLCTQHPAKPYTGIS